MASPRQIALKKIFDQLLATGGKQLFRQVPNPKKFMKEGFRRGDALSPLGIHPEGLYWGFDPIQARKMAMQKSRGLVTGMRLPDKNVRTMDEIEYKNFLEKTEKFVDDWYPPGFGRYRLPEALSRRLKKKGADFLDFPDYGYKGFPQTVQLKRGGVLAKWINAEGKEIYKIIGLSALMSALGLDKKKE